MLCLNIKLIKTKLHLIDKMLSFHMNISDLKSIASEGFKMTPIHFTISLDLVLNTLVDATCLSAGIPMCLDNKLGENFTSQVFNFSYSFHSICTQREIM